MLEMQLIMDEGLAGRLKACLGIFRRLDSGEGSPPPVRLPEGGSTPAGLQPGGGLRAAGILLCNALLGREEAEPLAAMEQLARTVPDRPFRRLCQNAAEMLRESPDWNLAALYACLRTVMVFLPESPPAASLPGLFPGSEPVGKELPAELEARFAWAEDAVIAYFDLPEGVASARIGEKTLTRKQCLAGVCLPPDTSECPVFFGERSALLKPSDPLRGLDCALGFRAGRFFLPARRTPRGLWKRLAPVLRVSGKPGARVPAMLLVSSGGQAKTEPCAVPPEGQCFLFCPPLDPGKDRWLELRCPGVRYVD